MPDGTHAGRVVEQRFFDRLPPHILASLTAEQRSAIAAAADEPEWTGHPINIRVSLPAILGRAYITIVAGRERRDGQRRRHDRVRNPLNTVGNLAFVFVAAFVFYISALAVASWI